MPRSWTSMSIRAFVDRTRRQFNPDHLCFVASGAVLALELEAPLVNTWVIYAIIGVVIPLLLWRVATQWKNRSQQAENLRVAVIILVWRDCRLAFHGQVNRPRAHACNSEELSQQSRQRYAANGFAFCPPNVLCSWTATSGCQTDSGA
jgi:hypothetical protein